MASATVRKEITRAQLQLRDKLWPELKEDRLWSRLRMETKGFITVPRCMPLILQIMDSLSKGKPVSSTYLDLWCRTFDESLVTLNKPQEMAFHSGFTGQRTVTTWRSRVKILSDLEFIDVKSGPSGPMSYALVYNPYLVIKDHHAKKTPGIGEDQYNALIARAIEIGAKDLD